MLNRVFTVLLSLFASTAVLGQSIDDRVRDLERRVEQLERQSANQSASAASRSQIAGGQDGWKRLENWRLLKRGMTEADVRGLLGEPHKVDAYGFGTVWQYPPHGGGDVSFSRDGKVGAWSEPSRTNIESQNPLLDWTDRIRAKIHGNIVLPPNIAGNPEAIFDVTLLPSGEVVDARMRKSSGHAGYDAAVERAIRRSSPLPKPDDPAFYRRQLELRFRPQS